MPKMIFLLMFNDDDKVAQQLKNINKKEIFLRKKET